jgi:hypothetical protein
MDFSPWNRAYALFPRSGFTYCKRYLLKEINEHYACQLAKYSHGGWGTHELLEPEEDGLMHPLQQYGRAGIGYSWILPFNTRGVVGNQNRDSVIDLSELG